MPHITDNFGRRAGQREMFECFLQFARTKCIDEITTERVRERIHRNLEAAGKLRTILAQIETDECEEAFRVELKKTFNADIVTSYVKEKWGKELKGPALGTVMQKVRQRISPHEVPTHLELCALIDEVIDAHHK